MKASKTTHSSLATVVPTVAAIVATGEDSVSATETAINDSISYYLASRQKPSKPNIGKRMHLNDYHYGSQYLLEILSCCLKSC